MQRNSTDCAICCISLATGLSYETVLNAAKEVYTLERGTIDTPKVLKNLNISYKVVYDKQKPTRRSLVSFEDRVDSLTGRTICHMMYFDGEEYHDPANNPREWTEIYRIIEL